MSEQNVPFLAFNRGLVNILGLARADLKRLALSAETFNNWVPRILGSMMLRPGLQYLNATRSNAAARFLPFVFSVTDVALIELTNLAMRVWVSDVLLTRVSVTTTITNGTFNTDLANWTDMDEAGGVSAWQTGGYMGLYSNGTAAAIREQTVTVAAGDQNKEHALNIIVTRGPVTLMVGSSSGGDDYITTTSLDTGVHSLAFTPTGNFYVRFQNRNQRIALVDACTVEAAGDLTVTAPWATADLGLIRTTQSADIIFCACTGYQQYKIERRAAHSWSVVVYESDDGPFQLPNVMTVTLTPSVYTGNGTLTASVPMFKSTDVGQLFAVTCNGQSYSKAVTAAEMWTDAVECTGVGTGRDMIASIDAGINGTGSRVRIQVSYGAPGTWTDYAVAEDPIQTAQSLTFNDGQDNQIIYYRIGIKTGEYVGAATINVTMATAAGTQRGVCRITAYTSTTVVSIAVLAAFGAVTASDNWEAGEWSPRRGWPSAVALYEGRLWWAGKDKIIGSVSDGYYSFDPTFQGDAAPISRTIGSGPLDTINWVLPLQRLILGGGGAEYSCRSNTFDEPLTIQNFNMKKAATQGSAPVQAVEIDDRGIFVQRGARRVFQLEMSAEKYDYTATHLSALVDTIGVSPVQRMAVQRQPDTRVHFVLSSGIVAILLFDHVENVVCWSTVDSTGSGGLIEDVVVLPGGASANEDQVYYVVKRTVNGATKRYLEKWANEADCIGGALNYQADSFVVYTGAAATSIPVAHLEGATVVAWTNGTCPKDANGNAQTYTVTSGAITLATASTNVVVGLQYTGQWKSGKLVQINAMLGTPLTQHKRITNLGLILAYTHPLGLEFGPDFTNMDPMPLVEEGATVNTDTIYSAYDAEPIIFPGTWSTDSRLCLQAKAPRPCTVLAAIAHTELND